MRIVDLGQNGGLPFTQNILDFMQKSYTEIAEALTMTNEPVILSGLSSSLSGTILTYEAGFIAVSGEVIKVSSGSLDTTNATPGQIKIVNLTTTLVYENGASHASMVNKVALIVQDNTGTILLDGLKTLYEIRSMDGFGQWQSFANSDISFGTVCNVQWRVNKFTKQCEVKGWAQHRTTSSGTGANMPLPVAVVENLPVPASTLYANTNLQLNSSWPIVKDANGSVLKQDTLRLVDAGGFAGGRIQIAFSALTGTPDLTKLLHQFNFYYTYI
ncbi:hypothetical protein D3C72_1173620 [compost metagenome]